MLIPFTLCSPCTCSMLVMTRCLVMMLVTISPCLWRIVTFVVAICLVTFYAVTMSRCRLIAVGLLDSIRCRHRYVFRFDRFRFDLKLNWSAIEKFPLYISGENSLALSWKKIVHARGEICPALSNHALYPPPRTTSRCIKIHRRA